MISGVFIVDEGRVLHSGEAFVAFVEACQHTLLVGAGGLVRHICASYPSSATDCMHTTPQHRANFLYRFCSASPAPHQSLS